MADLEKVQLLEAENRKLQSDILQLQGLVNKLKLQRDELYWEYETIRYKMNELTNVGSLEIIGRQE